MRKMEMGLVGRSATLLFLGLIKVEGSGSRWLYFAFGLLVFGGNLCEKVILVCIPKWSVEKRYTGCSRFKVPNFSNIFCGSK